MLWRSKEWRRGRKRERRIRALGFDHPVRIFIQAHAEFVQRHAAHEVCFLEDRGIDHEWHSTSLRRQKTLSGVIYEFFCFTPEIPGTTTAAASDALREQERQFKMISTTRTLLDEAESTLPDGENDRALREIIHDARRVLDLRDRAVEHIV